MKTPEEWADILWERTPAIIDRAAFVSLLKEALAGRDAEVARARADERLARCQLGDHLQEYASEWARIRAAALEEVRGRVLAWLDRELSKVEDSYDPPENVEEDTLRQVIAFLGSLGPARDPLPPTRAEEELEDLREGVRGVLGEMAGSLSSCESAIASGTEPFATEAECERDSLQYYLGRLRELLGEG